MSHLSRLQRPQVLRRTRVINDSTFCGYTHRVCMQPRLEGYDYCSRHILEDKNSPFKQCQYTSNKTNKRCGSAAVKADRKEGYCIEHARRAAHIRQFISRKRKQKQSPETLLEDLEHYTSRKHNGGTSDKKGRPAENVANKVMEYASSSDSDAEGLTVEHTWRGDGDSDAESVDSEQEDPLKHAGVYTAEEVALITRDKLIRLQSLYIDQFKRLQHVMKEKRRRYLHNVRKEREAFGSIHYAKHDPQQRSKYEGLVAMKRYHRRFGQEALLHRQSKERRIAVSEGPNNYRPPSYPKCIHSKNSGKCGARTVPLSKYCFEHIKSDPHQVLYKTCNFAAACRQPVAGMFDNSSCRYHYGLQDIDHRLPTKKDEKDESKDEIDVVGGTDIKQELPHQSLQLQIQIQKDHYKASEKDDHSDSNPTPVPVDRTEMSTTASKPPKSSEAKPQDSTECENKTNSADTRQLQPAESEGSPNQVSTDKPQPIQIDIKKARDILRPIAPQLSPVKPAQVPLVVSDLLEEEQQGLNQKDPSPRRRLVSPSPNGPAWGTQGTRQVPSSSVGTNIPMTVEDELSVGASKVPRLEDALPTMSSTVPGETKSDPDHPNRELIEHLMDTSK